MRLPSYATPCSRRRIPVPTLDDERFKAYLKQFRPLVPEPLPGVERGHGARRKFILGSWAAAAAVVVVLGAVTFHIRVKNARVAEPIGNAGSLEHLQQSQPLTMRSANAL